MRKAVFIVGTPAAGKTTLANNLARECRFEVLSGSSLLRAFIKQADSPESVEVSRAMSLGAPLGDKIILSLYRQFLERTQDCSIVLDGNPANETQFRGQLALLQEFGFPVRTTFCCLCLTSQDLMSARIERRRICTVCGRSSAMSHCESCGAATQTRQDDRDSNAVRSRVAWAKCAVVPAVRKLFCPERRLTLKNAREATVACARTRLRFSL